MNNRKVKKIAGVAIFIALVAVLQLVANYVTIGPVCITLALVPIALGAILYGPLVGGLLGLVMGGMVLVAPSTAAFISYKPVITIIMVLLKSGIAGFLCGLFFNLLKKKNFTLAVIIATISLPIVNTGIFALGCIAFYMDFLGCKIGELFLVVIGFNFLIEFGVNAALTTAIAHIVKIATKNHDFGFTIEENKVI